MAATLPIKDREKVNELLYYLRTKSPRDALLFQTGVNTVLRIGDLLRLKVKDVYKDGKIREYIELNEQKTGKFNRIKITKTLAPVLENYIKRYGLAEFPDYYLFFKTKHDHGRNEPITRDWASKVLCAAAATCGIENFNTQSMRKTHAYHVYMATEKNIALVQRMLNHSHPAVTLRYIGVEQSEIDAAKEIISF